MRSTKAAARASLVGRDAELDDLTRALARNRLVSMTGPPGVGKSTLAAVAGLPSTRKLVH